MTNYEDQSLSTSQPTEFPPLPREIQRQLARLFELKLLELKPLASSHNGHMLTAHDGAQYVRVNGGLRRVAIAEDGVHVIAKWSKARRRAEKRKRIRAGASGTNAQPSAE